MIEFTVRYWVYLNKISIILFAQSIFILKNYDSCIIIFMNCIPYLYNNVYLVNSHTCFFRCDIILSIIFIYTFKMPFNYVTM